MSEIARQAVYDWLDVLSLDISRKSVEEIITNLLGDQNIQEALIQVRTQFVATQNDNIITTFMDKFIWNRLDQDGAIAVADVWYSETKRNPTFFFTMSRIHEEPQAKVSDEQLTGDQILEKLMKQQGACSPVPSSARPRTRPRRRVWPSTADSCASSRACPWSRATARRPIPVRCGRTTMARWRASWARCLWPRTARS